MIHIFTKQTFFGNNPGRGYLFHLDERSRGEFIVKDSYVTSFNKTGGVEPQNIIDEISSHFLPHLSTYICEAEIPLPPLHEDTEQIVELFPVFIKIPNKIPEVFFGLAFTI